MEILNKRARFDYFIEEEIEAGIVLTGTEIKSVRAGKCNIVDCYGIIKNNEIFLLNMFISHYKEGNIYNHDETRTRKLLLRKKEIKKLSDAVSREGKTIIPLKLYFKDNKLKVLLGLAKGKKNYDKRESIKENDLKREAQKKIKKY